MHHPFSPPSRHTTIISAALISASCLYAISTPSAAPRTLHLRSAAATCGPHILSFRTGRGPTLMPEFCGPLVTPDSSAICPHALCLYTVIQTSLSARVVTGLKASRQAQVWTDSNKGGTITLYGQTSVTQRSTRIREPVEAIRAPLLEHTLELLVRWAVASAADHCTFSAASVVDSKMRSAEAVSKPSRRCCSSTSSGYKARRGGWQGWNK